MPWHWRGSNAACSPVLGGPSAPARRWRIRNAPARESILWLGLGRVLHRSRRRTAFPTKQTFPPYAEMMAKCADFVEKAEAYDADNMSPADSAYYLEVMTRVNTKLAKVAYTQ